MPRTRPSITKRNREQARRDRQAKKAAKRRDRAEQRRDKLAAGPGDDPDLAGIVAGPQPADPGEVPSGHKDDESKPSAES